MAPGRVTLDRLGQCQQRGDTSEMSASDVTLAQRWGLCDGDLSGVTGRPTG